MHKIIKLVFLSLLFLCLNSCKTIQGSGINPYSQEDYYYDFDYDYYDYDDYDRG